MILDEFRLTEQVAVVSGGGAGIDGGTTAPTFTIPVPPLQPQAR